MGQTEMENRWTGIGKWLWDWIGLDRARGKGKIDYVGLVSRVELVNILLLGL